jgi:hypothetical protein
MLLKWYYCKGAPIEVMLYEKNDSILKDHSSQSLIIGTKQTA